MRTLLLITACAAASLAGCVERDVTETTFTTDGEFRLERTSSSTTTEVVQVATRLDCPDREGDLRLASRASDGRACAYRGEDGAEVELRLASASDLQPLETELRALVPAAAPPPQPPLPPQPPAPPDLMAEGGEGRFRIPGVIDVRSEGERASVRLPGVRVEAQGENADVSIGGKGGETVKVRAHDGGAEVRVSDMKDGGSVNSMFLVTSETAGPSGWRVAGYQARGAGGGPLVVGVLRARGERRGDLMNDVEELLDRNLKG